MLEAAGQIRLTLLFFFFFKVSHYFLLFLGQFRCPSAGLTASHPFRLIGNVCTALFRQRVRSDWL